MRIRICLTVAILSLSRLTTLTTSAAGDTFFKSACAERKQFTWDKIEEAAKADWLRIPVNSEEFRTGKPPQFDDGMKAKIWSLLTSPEMGPAGGGVTLYNLTGAGLSGLDTGLTHLGGLLAVVQLYNDYQNNNPSMQVNFAKSASFWSIGTFSVFSNTLKTAAVGIGLFDYTLNKLGSVTSSMRYEFWEKAYAAHYDAKFGYRITTRWDAGLGRNVIDRDDTEKWIDLIFRQYSGDVDRAMKEGFSDFWNDPEGNALNVGMNPYGKFVQNILEDDRETIRKAYLYHVLPSIRTAFAWKKDRAQRDLVIEFQLAADKIYDELHKELIFFGWVTDPDGWPLEGVSVQLFGETPVITKMSGKYEIRIKACELFDSFQIRGCRQADLIAKMNDPLGDSDHTELKRVDIVYVAGTPLKEQGPHDIVMQTRDVTAIALSPDNIVVREGSSAEIAAIATLSDGSTIEITDKVTWHFSEHRFAVADGHFVRGISAGKTELRSEYLGKSSSPCRVSVTPAKELIKFDVSPPLLKLKPGETATLNAWALFSDGERANVSLDPACRWDTRSNAIALARNQVTAIKALHTLTPPTVEVSYLSGAKTLSASVPVHIGEDANILLLKLNKSDIQMGFHENVGLRATAIIGNGPLTSPVDVTDKIRWKTSDITITPQIADGVIVSGNTEGVCEIEAGLEQTDGTFLTAVCIVTVVDKSEPLPDIDFTITPQKYSHGIGENITFMQQIDTQDLNGYDLIWFIGSEERSGESVNKIFNTSGNYTVRLVVRSKKTGKEDSISKTVRIEAAPDADCSISVAPGPYTAPATLIFSALCTDVTGSISELRWYIDGELKQGGIKTTFVYTFGKNGKYLVKLGMRRGSNFDESIRTLVISIGDTETPVENAARLVNRFDLTRADSDLHVAGSYWIGGDGKWSDWLRFDHIRKVQAYAFCTGDAEDGFNTGYLVYGLNPDTLMFKVYGYNFKQRKGRIVYDGTLDLHGKQLDPPTLRVVDCQPRAAVFEWRCTDGSLCKAQIYKTPQSGYVAGGVEDMGCVEGNPAAKQRRSIKEALEAAAQNQHIQPGEVTGPQYEGLEEMAEDLNFGVPECMYTIRGNLPDANGGSVEVYVFDDAAEARNGLQKWKKYFTNLGSNYETDVTPASFHELQAYTWTLYYSEKTEKNAKRIAKSGKSGEDTFKDWIGYKHYGRAWIHDNVWISLYTKQNTSAGRAAATALAEAIYSEMVAIAAVRFFCEGEGLIIKEFSYRNSVWPARLQNGKLEVRGANDSSGKWTEKTWVTVANDVSSFGGDGTSQGPVVIYATGNKWHIVMIDWKSGHLDNPRSFDEPIRIKQTGKYGAVIEVGDTCYDYSWKKLKKVRCN